MIVQKKEFYIGSGLLAGFVVVLIIMFSPLFNQQNALEFLDDLYNSISKGSAYYIPKIKEKSVGFTGRQIGVDLLLADNAQAEQSAPLFVKAGGRANVSGNRLNVEGDLGKILENCLSDADRMYFNDGQSISDKYGRPAQQVLYDWWQSLNAMDKALKKQKKFAEAKAVKLAINKAVECSYNYYQIEPQKISDRLGIVIFSLVFYIIYTLWYGFAIMYIFVGIGLKLEH
jgi:hypothetical protein